MLQIQGAAGLHPRQKGSPCPTRKGWSGDPSYIISWETGQGLPMRESPACDQEHLWKVFLVGCAAHRQDHTTQAVMGGSGGRLLRQQTTLKAALVMKGQCPPFRHTTN